MLDDIQRQVLLTEGQVFGDFWFNEKTSHSFMTLTTFAQLNDIPAINWPNKNREWVTIPTAQAVEMCKLVIQTLQSVYQNNPTEEA